MSRISLCFTVVFLVGAEMQTGVIAADAADVIQVSPNHISGIVLSAAKPTAQETVLLLYGELKPNSEHTAKLMTKMPGFVIDAPVALGEQVGKNQILAKLTSYKLGEYYSTFNTASEREQLALSEFKMAESLYQKNAVSEREFLRAKREYAEAVIARQHAEALLNTYSDSSLAKSEESGEPAIRTDYYIRAPFAGTVISKDIYKGENFAEDSDRVFFTVSDLSSLYLDLRATASQLAELAVGMTAQVQPANTKRIVNGRIIYVSPVVDPASRTGLVRLLVPNPNGLLRPGQLAAGRVNLPHQAPAVAVEDTAIQNIDGEPMVFVPSGGGYMPVRVAVGKTENRETIILSGLTPGEMYVSHGALELKSLLMTDGLNPPPTAPQSAAGRDASIEAEPPKSDD